MRIDPMARIAADGSSAGPPDPASSPLVPPANLPARIVRSPAPNAESVPSQHNPPALTRRTMPTMIDALLRAPTLEDLFEILPPRVGEYLGCRRIVLYVVSNSQAQDGTLDLVGCTADATTQGWSSTLIRLAPIEPIALHSQAPEARALRGEHAVIEAGGPDLPTRIIMPMQAIGGPIGVLVAIPSADEVAWGGDGLRASQTFLVGLEDVARICAVILQNRLLFLENRERTMQMDLLQRLTTAFNSSVLDLEATIGIVERQLSQITRATRTAIALGPLDPTASPTASRWLRPELITILLQARGGAPVLLPDLDQWAHAHLLPPDITSFYAFYLMAEDRVAGCLALGYRERHQLTDSVQSLIAILANNASSVLIKSRLHAEAESARQQSRDLLERAQREERFKDDILRNILSGLLVVDNTGRVLLLNPQGAAILGCTERQALGRPVEEVMPLLQTTPGPHLIRASIGPRVPPRRLEARLRVGENPSEIVLILTISPLRLRDGKEMGVICAFQDISEIRALEEQARQLKNSSREVSHDMRNVAQALLSALYDLMPKLEGNAEARVVLNRIYKDTGRLKSLAENILSLGRPRPPQLAICDATEMIESVLRGLEHGAGVAHVRIERQLEQGATVLADDQQLMRVIENLCINAIEAMPKGGVLTVTTRTARRIPTTPPTGEPLPVPVPISMPGVNGAIQTDLLVSETRQRAVEIEITDTGIGIPPERVQEIWEPFKTFGKRNGHGLGLAIVRQIIDAHGGTIHVQSIVGQGTTFSLRLPAGRADRGNGRA